MREEITMKASGNQERVDDETVAYILVAQKYFEDLRQIAAQLAGLLVLAASGGKSATPDHPMLDAAERLHESASAGIRTLRATARASVHRDYLSRAAAALECALSSAHSHLWRADHSAGMEPILHPLQAAYEQLRLAAAALPGFEMVSFNQACCGPQTKASHIVASGHDGARPAK